MAECWHPVNKYRQNKTCQHPAINSSICEACANIKSLTLHMACRESSSLYWNLCCTLRIIYYCQWYWLLGLQQFRGCWWTADVDKRFFDNMNSNLTIFKLKTTLSNEIWNPLWKPFAWLKTQLKPSQRYKKYRSITENHTIKQIWRTLRWDVDSGIFIFKNMLPQISF